MEEYGKSYYHKYLQGQIRDKKRSFSGQSINQWANIQHSN